VITLRVDGEPAPQGSKSVGRHGGVYEKSKKVKPWRDAIRAAALARTGAAASAPVTGAVTVNITFWLPRPAGHYRTGRNSHLLHYSAPRCPLTRPDLDKLVRSTLDGLKEAGIYGDDGQVVDLSAHKRYADAINGEKPGAEIEIWGES
jgi:Holliday junction resolvase RusA-like endonuclease